MQCHTGALKNRPCPAASHEAGGSESASPTDAISTQSLWLGRSPVSNLRDFVTLVRLRLNTPEGIFMSQLESDELEQRFEASVRAD